MSKKRKRANGASLSSRHSSHSSIGSKGRKFPLSFERKTFIEKVLAKSEERRTAEEVYLLGSYQLYDGIIAEDDHAINTAVTSLTQAASRADAVWMANLDLGWILLVRGLDSIALPYLEKATVSSPFSRDAWSLRAWAHIGTGDRAKAIECLTQAEGSEDFLDSDRSLLQDLHNNVDLAELRKGLALSYHGDVGSALNHDVGFREFLLCNIFALEQQRKRLSENVDLLCALGKLRYGVQQYDESEKLLVDCVSRGCEDSEIFTMLALINSKRGDIFEAKRLYKAAIELDPSNALALCNLASELQKSNQYVDARPLLERVLELGEKEPYYPLALDLYGSNVGTMDGDFKKEASLHKKAFQLESGRETARINYLIALICLGDVWELRQAYEKQVRWIRSEQGIGVLRVIDAIVNAERSFEEQVGVSSLVFEAFGPTAAVSYIHRAWHGINDKTDVQLPKDSLAHLGTVAGQCGQHEIAVELWREAYKRTGDQAFLCNIPVDLSALGRFDEAVAALDAMPMTVPRAWTIRANTLESAGRDTEALEAYEAAVNADDDFLLPLNRQARLARKMCRWEVVDAVIKRLYDKWTSSVDGVVVLAEVLLNVGKPREAASVLELQLKHDDEFTSIDQIDVAEDITLLGRNDFPNWAHYLLGTAYLRAHMFDELHMLYEWVVTKQGQGDGNWIVLAAEYYRISGSMDSALNLLSKMKEEQPPLTSVALCKLADDHFEEAAEIAHRILALRDVKTRYFHPSGNPLAVARAVLALVALESVETQQALSEAEHAVKEDQDCTIAWFALLRSMETMGDERLIETAGKAIEYCPGNPQLVDLLVSALIDSLEFDKADDVLSRNRDACISQREEKFTSWLGEKIARAKLLWVEQNKGRAPKQLEWAAKLDLHCQGWIESAYSAELAIAWLRIAVATCVGKVAERELVLRIFEPYKNSFVAKGGSPDDNQFRDVSGYLKGKNAPSLGAMHKIFQAALASSAASDTDVLRIFRDFLTGLGWSGATELRTYDFVSKLKILADLRNRAAHIGEPTATEVESAIRFVIDGESPGELLRALGVQ